MLPSAHPKLLFVLTILLLSASIESKVVQVPIEKLDTIFDMKFGQKYEIDYPQFDIKQIRERHVSLVNANQSKIFPFCRIASPEISFTTIDRVTFEGLPPKPLLIYEFKDILYEQALLDAYFQNNQIFAFFQDGTIAYVRINSNFLITQNKIIRSSGMGQEQKLSNGYFIKMKNTLLFVSGKYIFTVDNQQSTTVKSYKSQPKFESVTAINDRYFAIVTRQAIRIYEFNEEKKEVSMLDEHINQKENLFSPKESFSDIFYYKKKEALLVLDQKEGIKQVKIDYSKESAKIEEINTVYQKEDCRIFSINSKTETLHVLCSFMVEINLENWPKFQEVGYKNNPGIKVQEIYCHGPFTAFIGRDAFSVMYFNKFVSYYQDANLDRLIFTPDIFISANEDSLLIGTYNLTNSYVSCEVTEKQYLGDYPLLFQTQAACSQDYFQAYNVSVKDYEEGDLCLYATQQTVHVWKGGQLMIKQIEIIGIIFIGLLLAGLFFVGYKKWDLHKARKQYDSFLMLNETKNVPESAENVAKEEINDVQPAPNASESKLKDDEPQIPKKSQKNQEKDKKEQNKDQEKGQEFEIQ